MPNQSGHIYLVTNRHGQYRMIVVGRPTIAGEMYGILTTLQAGRGTLLTPVTAPVALVPIAAEETGGLQFGRIAPGDTGFETCRRHIDRVISDGFAIFLMGS